MFTINNKRKQNLCEDDAEINENVSFREAVGSLILSYSNSTHHCLLSKHRVQNIRLLQTFQLELDEKNLQVSELETVDCFILGIVEVDSRKSILMLSMQVTAKPDA